MGREVASKTRDKGFKVSHRQFFISFNCIEKTKIKVNEAENGPIFKVTNLIIFVYLK